MKNLFLVAVIGLLSATTIYAQSDDTTIQFGVKGGVNLAKITGDDVGDLDSRTSFHLGLFMEVPLSERFSFQPEVMYSSQGFSINDRADYKLDYIQVPLIAKVYLVKGLYAEAGPQFGFKTKEEVKYESGSIGGDFEFDPEDSVVKNFDTNLALGAGYKFDNGLSLSARYNLGLTNMIKDDAPIISGRDVKNSVWQFGVGFSF
ncbi:porin family protein [Gelidibacter sp.]|uniref:porin family protein n=1 Tax=Gelidibacter sp. TaxID=2018083 RepID=UPI002C05B95C|nr:porin family protein [Gelidibacter sp.]HUH28179.1 porin family protein [Gelidibacter sp.]